MKLKRVLIVCTGCQRKVELQRAMKVRKHPGDITELGIICPRCQQWTHALYETPATRAAQATLKAAPFTEREAALAAYNVVYVAEQARVKAELVANV